MLLMVAGDCPAKAPLILFGYTAGVALKNKNVEYWPKLVFDALALTTFSE